MNRIRKMHRIRNKHTAAAALTGAAIAAAVGIATGAAASSKDSTAVPRPFLSDPNGEPHRAFGGPPRILSGPPVHAEIVVPDRDGDDFVTITRDSGTAKSVSGDQLTITEGTKQATYRTVTFGIPGDARVLRNGEQAELDDLQAGDQVNVLQAPKKTVVFALDSQRLRSLMRNHRGVRLRRPPGVPALPPGPPPMPLLHGQR